MEEEDDFSAESSLVIVISTWGYVRNLRDIKDGIIGRFFNTSDGNSPSRGVTEGALNQKIVSSSLVVA